MSDVGIVSALIAEASAAQFFPVQPNSMFFEHTPLFGRFRLGTTHWASTLRPDRVVTMVLIVHDKGFQGFRRS